MGLVTGQSDLKSETSVILLCMWFNINFRDGAGCFGNDDGVPPAEVKDMKNNTITKI